jgi:hypothetical protein
MLGDSNITFRQVVALFAWIRLNAQIVPSKILTSRSLHSPISAVCGRFVAEPAIDSVPPTSTAASGRALEGRAAHGGRGEAVCEKKQQDPQVCTL